MMAAIYEFVNGVEIPLSVTLDDGTEILFGKKIGYGSFSSVYEVQISNERYACKLIPLPIMSPSAQEVIRREIDLVSEIIKTKPADYPKSLLCYYKLFELDLDYYQTPVRTHCIITDLAATPLSENYKAQSIDQIIDAALCLVDALGWLHKNNILHRDVKLSNMVIMTDGAFKLIDLGLAKYVQGVTDTQLGSAGYMHPKIIRNESYGFEVDLYAFSVALNTLLSRSTISNKDPRYQRLWDLQKKISEKVQNPMSFSAEQSFQELQKTAFDLIEIRNM